MTKSILPKLADPNAVPPRFRAVADLSFLHLTEEDAQQLINGGPEEWYIGQCGPCGECGPCGKHFGYFLETFGPDQTQVAHRAGVSKPFTKLINHLHEKEIYYVSFDSEGPILEGFPTFQLNPYARHRSQSRPAPPLSVT